VRRQVDVWLCTSLNSRGDGRCFSLTIRIFDSQNSTPLHGRDGGLGSDPLRGVGVGCKEFLALSADMTTRKDGARGRRRRRRAGDEINFNSHRAGGSVIIESARPSDERHGAAAE